MPMSQFSFCCNFCASIPIEMKNGALESWHPGLSNALIFISIGIDPQQLHRNENCNIGNFQTPTLDILNLADVAEAADEQSISSKHPHGCKSCKEVEAMNTGRTHKGVFESCTFRLFHIAATLSIDSDRGEHQHVGNPWVPAF